jgi:hypothetical protein
VHSRRGRTLCQAKVQNNGGGLLLLCLPMHLLGLSGKVHTASLLPKICHGSTVTGHRDIYLFIVGSIFMVYGEIIFHLWKSECNIYIISHQLNKIILVKL